MTTPAATRRSPSLRRDAARWALLAFGLGLLGLAACWLADVTDHGGRALGRGLLPATLFALVVLAVLGTRATLLPGPGAARRRWLFALLLLAATVRFAGADFEVGERAYRDEGTYYHHATEIDRGELLRWSFIYPHLLYYAYAFALWLAGLFPGVWAGLVGQIFGVTEPLARDWLTLRLVVAALSAATVVPVFGLGRRLAGISGGVLGGLLFVFSPLFNEGSHLIIADVPSACLATFCLLPVSRLLRRETLRDYLLAGILAGLAAATKYPAGVVAMAIAAAWLRGRLRTRRWSWSLLWAALAAIIALVAAMPSLLWAPRHALGDQGMLFGLNQYSRGGWIGVLPDSHALYYAGHLLATFGLPAAVLGLGGLLLLPRRHRVLAVWLLAFPLAYLTLIVSMHMVVLRNLHPVVPVTAVLLGAGVAACARRLGRVWQDRRRTALPRLATLGLVTACLALPVYRTSVQAVGLARASTREVAAAWIEDHLPPGVAIVQESYTPRLDPARYALTKIRFAARLSPEELVATDQDFVFLAYNAYARFLEPGNLREEHHEEYAERYRTMLGGYEEVADFHPTWLRRGPWLRLFRVVPQDLTDPPRRQRLGTEGAFVPDGSMRPPRADAPVRFTRPGQWALLKGSFPAGSYLVRPVGRVDSPARLRVATLRGETVSDLPALPEAGWSVDLPAPGKYLWYAYLPEGSRLAALVVRPDLPEAADEP
ncbi:MAG: glycosyltransferase family 39 protein [Acidobacteria bacterium]|nr:glycosyltransferase family 39 protein [Acidobacteriota bacterium]